ncbi:MAG TPA: prepilin-type N-terminal cleavage/methylation domain-containing protein [Lacipirellulaceae bacterium]|nr:prepilin-type N-terminal cleavage/methylation domain-containing protein [Lacipirellulaceae bacterium]
MIGALSIVSCPLSVVGRSSAFNLRRTTDRGQQTSSRRGFTLIELLIVMFIITILASLILGVAALAAQTAKENGTRHTVERLHTLLTEYYGTFKTRRIQLRDDNNPTNGQKGILSQINAQFSNPNDASKRGQATAEARMYALRETMLLDMPDRWSDVLLNDIGPTGSGGAPSSVVQQPFYLQARTELSNVYLRRYLALVGKTNTVTRQANTADNIRQNQGAECLYMIVTLACGDGEARAQFGEHIIGDTDGDGAPEFLDGWGHPIDFIRWAPGFESQIEMNVSDLPSLSSGSLTPADKTKIAKDHDPFDIFRMDPVAYRLVPLIVSGGRDESEGLFTAPTAVVWSGLSSTSQTIVFNSGSNPPFIGKPALSPYVTRTDTATSTTNYLGTSLHVVDSTNNDETSTDNVHNHLLGQR